MRRWLLRLLGGRSEEPKPVVAEPAPETALPPVAELPRQCPECGSPHQCEMHPVTHSFPSGRVQKVEPGVVFCAICGTVYVCTPAGIERRKQRQPEAPPTPNGPEARPDMVSKAMEALKWRRPKV